MSGVLGLFWNMHPLVVNLTAHGAGEECRRCPSTLRWHSAGLCCPQGSFIVNLIMS